MAARALLGETVQLRDAVTQWANLGGLVAALYTEDWELMRRSLHDVIAEPIRARQVPGFQAVKSAAIDAGALGCSLSGSGPALFALCRGRGVAQTVVERMAETMRAVGKLDSDRYVSPVSAPGARCLAYDEPACAS